jgi:hypothetical protein
VARRTLLLIASILLAALGTALIWLYVQRAETLAQPQLVPALFLTRGVEAGTTLDASMVTVRNVPPDVAAGAVTTLAQVAGKQLTVPAVAQQLVLQSMFTGTPQGRFPQGGAASLTITDPHRVPKDLQIGDLVDVYAISPGKPLRLAVRGIKVRTLGGSGLDVPGAGAQTGAGGVAAPTIAGTIVGFDADDDQAKALYAIEPNGEQPVLYVRNPQR